MAAADHELQRRQRAIGGGGQIDMDAVRSAGQIMAAHEPQGAAAPMAVDGASAT